MSFENQHVVGDSDSLLQALHITISMEPRLKCDFSKATFNELCTIKKQVSKKHICLYIIYYLLTNCAYNVDVVKFILHWKVYKWLWKFVKVNNIDNKYWYNLLNNITTNIKVNTIMSAEFLLYQDINKTLFIDYQIFVSKHLPKKSSSAFIDIVNKYKLPQELLYGIASFLLAAADFYN